MVSARCGPIARGPGPRWLRLTFAGLAGLYFTALLKRPPRSLPAVTFFTEAACLFPGASTYAIEFRLEGWACGTAAWQPMDPRPYFPIEADNKESRFQRAGYFYQRNRPVMRALDDWIVASHRARPDDPSGPIGGIRIVKVLRPIPAPGQPVERYRYQPLADIPADGRRDMYWTRASERRARCEAAR